MNFPRKMFRLSLDLSECKKNGHFIIEDLKNWEKSNLNEFNGIDSKYKHIERKIEKVEFC
jgi:hypothetical protein